MNKIFGQRVVSLFSLNLLFLYFHVVSFCLFVFDGRRERWQKTTTQLSTSDDDKIKEFPNFFFSSSSSWCCNSIEILSIIRTLFSGHREEYFDRQWNWNLKHSMHVRNRLANQRTKKKTMRERHTHTHKHTRCFYQQANRENLKVRGNNQKKREEWKKTDTNQLVNTCTQY